MFTKKSIGIALGCALALGVSGIASATLVNVDGVMVDTSAPNNFEADASGFRESSVSQTGDVLSGYGLISLLNGEQQSEFCPGCELTFTFQYTVANVDTSGTNPQVVFTDGTIQFYVDNTSSFNVFDPTTADNGTPWLTLSGDTAAHTGFTFLGQLYATISGPVADPGTQSSGFGLLNATGGPAMSFFDTNSQADGADFTLSSSFFTDVLNTCGTTPTTNLDDACTYPISGTGNLKGLAMMPTSVPEPGELGLLGLGLGFLGFFVWRRRKESDRNA